MKEKIHIKNIRELSVTRGESNDMRKKINCITIDHADVYNQFSSAVYFDAIISILVLSGKADIYINYKSYPISNNTLLILSSAHLFHFYECSKDFKCICLFVSRDFINEMDSTDMIYQRIKYGVRLYNTPIMFLNENNKNIALKRINAINDAIDNTGHFYYKEVILNNLFAFYLDLSNIIEHNSPASRGEGNPTRYESIIKSFIELLAANYREEHKVDFYASQLNLSAHYLTLIVKRVTGQSVSDFIFEMLYSESRTLLTHSKLSIQEISSVLNFSDQSSFGKFFKRKAGISPADFRKKR